MNDKELADAVAMILDAKKGEGFTADNYFLHHIGIDQYLGFNAESFVRDWRVSGAMLEKCQKVYIEYIGEPEQTVYARAADNRTWEWPTGESLPRTINEACAVALGAV